MRKEIQAEVNTAADEADAAPQPEPGRIMAHIYSDKTPFFEEKRPVYVSEDTISMVEALNRALREEMEHNPKIVMWGEDIADPKGGVFGVTRGLTNQYPDRVQNSPLSEASIVGVAGGMAIGGYKPIVEIQFADYSWPGFMQMRNEIPTLRWRSNGTWSDPVVVRMACGGRIKGGPFHSQCVEAMYAHTPGWYIVFPSNAEDAKGLIKTAARCEDPVLFLEHKRLYRHISSKAREPNADYLIPFGKGRVRRQGNAATIVTWGATVYTALEIADEFDLEVIDLRTIVPMDDELVFSSVKTYPHDNGAFTQGLEYRDGYLYEGTGREGRSSLRKVDLSTGRVTQKYDLPRPFFGEGITVLNQQILELTYTTQTGFIYDK